MFRVGRRLTFSVCSSRWELTRTNELKKSEMRVKANATGGLVSAHFSEPFATSRNLSQPITANQWPHSYGCSKSYVRLLVCADTTGGVLVGQ